MIMRNGVNTSDLRKPSGYKLRAEIAENRVRLLSGRVERLEAHLRAMEDALNALNANLEDALCMRPKAYPNRRSPNVGT